MICAVHFDVWFHGLKIENDQQLEKFRQAVQDHLWMLDDAPTNPDRPELEGDITVEIAETAGTL